MSVDFASHIRTVRDYPKPGVLFRDITTLLLKPDVFRRAIDVLAALYAQAGITRVVSIDARGFLIGSPLAYLLDAGQALIRKKGKLPASVIGEDYKLGQRAGNAFDVPRRTSSPIIIQFVAPERMASSSGANSFRR
ncbi:MAG: hypothetical protein LBB60_04925 [Desulfovibrio sp.]|jgi:adenine phosphoribosyltransferase|nr:hypothetical protein [Desulfovibrio sp.]